MFPNGHSLNPTEQRLYDLMRDGASHPVKQLIGCLYDEMGDAHNLSPHLTSLRKKIRRHGIGLRLERMDNETSYSFVRLLPPSHE